MFCVLHLSEPLFVHNAFSWNVTVSEFSEKSGRSDGKLEIRNIMKPGLWFKHHLAACIIISFKEYLQENFGIDVNYKSLTYYQSI